MSNTPKKDYFEYKDGEIVYKHNESNRKKLSILEAFHTNLNKISSTITNNGSIKSPTMKLSDKSRTLINIGLVLLVALSIFLVATSYSSTSPDSFVSLESQDTYAVITLRAIETEEFSAVEDYITSKTSSLYVKKAIAKHLEEKEFLLAKGGFSDEIESFIKNSIHHSTSILNALYDYDFTLVETLHNQYFKKQ